MTDIVLTRNNSKEIEVAAIDSSANILFFWAGHPEMIHVN